jgi:two-component system phosphate regulon sensor histidine kinase PhoR
MNQKYIWLVTIVLCISLSGLILVQINFFQSASKIKEEQLALTVSKALDQVVAELERAEVKQIILKGDVPGFAKGAVVSSARSGFNINIPMDATHNKTKLSFYSGIEEYSIGEGVLNPEALTGFSNWQDKFTNAFNAGGYSPGITARRLANSTLNLSERIDMGELPRLIKEKLKDNGIKLSFEYAVKSNNRIEKRSKNYYRNPSFEKYGKKLFPNDLFSKLNFIYIFFPGQQKYMVKSYSLLIPSFVLTLVLILSSAFTIYIIFRQKKLSNVKNDFINNMTHEFKTPIATISLASQMLKDNTVTTTASTRDHIAKIINDESRRLTYQVEKVLQMAVFNEVRMKLKLKTVSVHKIIQNLLPNFTIRVEDRKGNMYQNIDAEHDLVMADEVHLSNVFANLLDNAIKYSKDAPEVSISTRNKNKGIVITITDNGIGITKEDQKMIFERFFRVHTGNVHDVKGFGLGLSYVKKIVDAHNAQVSVDSIPDKGSKFEIYLPLKK